MKKIRAEQLREWFEDPETELRNFLSAGKAIMPIIFPDSGLVELNQREAAQLLEDLKVLREKEEELLRLREEKRKRTSSIHTGLKIG